MATSTKHNRLIQPSATDASKTPSNNTNFGFLEAGYTEQAIAGVALSAYQAVYLKAPAIGAAPTLTPSTTGGSLPTETLYVKIVAVIPNGPQYPNVTTAAFVATAEASAAITGPTGSCAVSWAVANGATTYQVWYGATAGGENQYITATGTSATITGAGTSGTVPTQPMPAQWQLSSDTMPSLPNQRYIIVVAGAAGTVCYGQYAGVVTNSAWTWTPGSVVYLSTTAGTLTQTAPNVTSMPIGLAISATEVSLFSGGVLGAFSGGTSGSILFIGTNGAIAQDNMDLFWNATNKRLGIGTINPSSAIEISGVLSSGDETAIRLTDTVGSSWRLSSGVVGLNHKNFGITDMTAGFLRLTIDSSGNVGIGASVPIEVLDVAGGVRATGLLRLVGTRISQGTIAVGASPFTYTNNDNSMETVYVAGGAISSIAFIRNGTTTTLTSADNVFVLSPGDALTITYTTAPTTMLKVFF